MVELELDAPPAQRVVAELTQLQDTSVVSALARPFSGAGALLLIFESCADGVLDRERLVLVLSDEGHLDGAREIAYQLCADAVFLCGLHCLTSSRLLSRAVPLRLRASSEPAGVPHERAPVISVSGLARCAPQAWMCQRRQRFWRRQRTKRRCLTIQRRLRAACFSRCQGFDSGDRSAEQHEG